VAIALKEPLFSESPTFLRGRVSVVSLSNEDWFFAGLFFYDMRDESGRTRDHENAIERRGIYSKIGEDRADGDVPVDWQRFSSARRRLSQLRAPLAYECHPPRLHARVRTRCRAGIFVVQPMSKSRKGAKSNACRKW